MKTRILLETALAVLGLSAHMAWGAPITFNTALPVRSDGTVIREQFILMRNSDDPTAAGRDMEVTALLSVLGYGVTRDFALFGMIPYAGKSLRMDTGGQTITRQQSGLGDLILLGRYTVHEDDSPGQTFRIAPFLGVKSPTGRDNAKDRLGLLPPPLQPGTGSWDALGGAVLTWQTLDFEVDGQVSYKANGQADGFQAGNVAEFDGSLQYRLFPRSLGTGVPAFLYGVLETNLVLSGEDRVDETPDSNSGGSTLFITPGLQYVTREWIAEAGIQLSVAQQLNGTALRNDYVLTGGLRLNL